MSTERKLRIGVLGPGSAPAKTLALAQEVGAEIARRGAILVCGGLGGVMETAAHGAQRGGGLTVGIVPGIDDREANESIDVPVVTGMGEARNLLVVRSSNAVIAIAGSFGTLSEIALALKIGVPVVGLGTWELCSPNGDEPPIIRASSPQEAVAKAVEAAADVSQLSIPDLLRDESLRRREFPVCEKKAFLAHAGVSPLPRRVAEAMQQYVAAAARDNQENVLTDAVIAETRALAAQLVGAQPEEIGFVGSTSMGLAMVAAGLPWKPGDNVVCYRDDYPANVYPWMDLARQGVEVRFVEPKQFGNVTVEDVERVVDRNTRLVSLASVHFQSGWRLEVDQIGQFLRERGVLFCLDGIQSLGALRTSMRLVDFAAADAHKWLLGPLGTAILYVRRDHFDRLHPPLVGWHSASCPDFIAQETLAFKRDARRYEPGSLNLAGIVGFRAALQLIRECGTAAVEERVLALAKQVIARGIAAGFSLVGPSGGAGMSGIISLTTSERAVVELHAKLEAANIVTSLRSCRDGRRCLRISPHFYNREEEILAPFHEAQP